MFILPLMLVAASGLETYLDFEDKRALVRGLKTPAHFYLVTIAELFFTIPLFLIWPMQMTIGWLAFLVIVLGTFARTLNVVGLVKCMDEISPLEVTAYTTIAIIVTYFIDMLIGSASFDVVSALALLVIIAGCIYIARQRHGFKKIRWQLILHVIGVVGGGYVIYYALNSKLVEMNNLTYIFWTCLLTVLIMTPFYKKIKTEKDWAVKWAFKIELFWLAWELLDNAIAQISVTMYMLVPVITMLFTFPATYVFKRDMGSLPNKKQVVGAFIVLVGVTIYVIAQLKIRGVIAHI